VPGKINEWFSDYLVFTYKLHTNILNFLISYYENFEVLIEDDIYMGL